MQQYNSVETTTSKPNNFICSNLPLVISSHNLQMPVFCSMRNYGGYTRLICPLCLTPLCRSHISKLPSKSFSTNAHKADKSWAARNPLISFLPCSFDFYNPLPLADAFAQGVNYSSSRVYFGTSLLRANAIPRSLLFKLLKIHLSLERVLRKKLIKLEILN